MGNPNENDMYYFKHSGKRFVMGLVIFARSMKIISFKILVFAIPLVLIWACNSSKSYYKKGTQLQQAGMQEEAAEYFLLALRKNSNNIDARIALNSEGQKLLESKLQDFYKLYTSEDYIGATKKYRECEEYVELVKPYVKLELPPYYQDYYQEAKAVFLEDRYKKASDLINENKFEAANSYLQEIIEIEPTYKDVASLKKYSTVEPVYRDAMQEYEAGHYRKAYELFSRVLKMNGNYKEARYYKDEALAKGMVTVAVLGIQTDSENEHFAQAIRHAILQKGSQKTDPFVVYIDRENMDAILSEQKLTLTGVLNENSAAETGKILGAKYLIQGKILEYQHTENGLAKEIKKGYHEVVTRKYNKAQGFYYNEKTYQKTTYEVYTMKRTIVCRVELSLVSAETGAVVLSQVYDQKEEDELSYAIYPKDPKALYPGSYKSKIFNSPDDRVNKNVIEKQKLEQMLAEKRRNVVSENQLANELAQSIAMNWVWRIKKYSKSLE